MKHFTLTICATTLLLFSCNNSGEKTDAATTDSPKTEQPVTKDAAPAAMPDSAAMMKAWMDFATPGAMHTWMAKTNGTWEAEVSNWMAPDAPPMKSKAINVQSSVLGGRYVIGKFTGTMMGQPFEGMSTMGYDNAKKLFTRIYV